MPYRREITVQEMRREISNGDYQEAFIRAGEAAFEIPGRTNLATLMHLEGEEPGIGPYYEHSDMVVRLPDNLVLGHIATVGGCGHFEAIRISAPLGYMAEYPPNHHP